MFGRRLIIFLLLSLMAMCSGCGSKNDESGTEQVAKNRFTQGKEHTMELKSPAFEHGGNIPSEYTCDGKNVSPPLVIEGTPKEAESLALVMDDPDAPGSTFDHWLVWNIAPDTEEVSEAEQPEGVGGENDFGNLDYGGPCPPSGTHSYQFKIYALDTELELEEGSTKSELEQAIEGHVLAKDLLIGNYSRQ